MLRDTKMLKIWEFFQDLLRSVLVRGIRIDEKKNTHVHFYRGLI